MECIVEAIYTSERKPLLIRANLHLEHIRILIQISVENHYIALSQYEFISRDINETGAMIGGWLKKCDR